MTDDAGASHVRFERDGPVAVITLDRPEVLNAFSTRMGREVQDAYRRCDADDDIRAVVLTGAGRAFCAGADLRSGTVFAAPGERDEFRSDPFVFHPWDVRKPVIAAINGHAVGLGLTMALQCDIRYVAADARCGIVQNRRGVVPDLRSHWTLPRLVGYGRATDLLLTGRMFSGADAASWGLASEALAADQVLPRALEVAHEIATHVAPLSVGLSKQLLWSGPPISSDEIDDLERRIHLLVMGRPDAKEGALAFVEKREPDWESRVPRDWPEELAP